MVSTDAIRKFAVETAVTGGKATLTWFRQSPTVENKATEGAFDPVTEADRACERIVRKRIQATYPHHGIRGEEFDDVDAGDYTWIVDPIDGTRAFISGFLHWGVLLGLLRQDKPELGVLAQPFTGEVFSGDSTYAYYSRGGEDIRIGTSQTQRLNEATFATTDPHLFEGDTAASVLKQIESSVRLIRYGCDCYQYAMLAMGQLDLVVENQLQPWDILPLIPIIRGAGGVVTNWQGEEDWSAGEAIASANTTLHEQALERLNAR